MQTNLDIHKYTQAHTNTHTDSHVGTQLFMYCTLNFTDTFLYHTYLAKNKQFHR